VTIRDIANDNKNKMNNNAASFVGGLAKKILYESF
jgi:hypothetical protein